MAYIGDSTPEKERGGGMGLLGAAGGVGTILGPGLGGLLAGRSLSTPFFIAAGLSLLSLLLAWLFLPESLPAEAPAKSAQSRTWRTRAGILDCAWLRTTNSPIRVLFI